MTTTHDGYINKSRKTQRLYPKIIHTLLNFLCFFIYFFVFVKKFWFVLLIISGAIIVSCDNDSSVGIVTFAFLGRVFSILIVIIFLISIWNTIHISSSCSSSSINIIINCYSIFFIGKDAAILLSNNGTAAGTVAGVAAINIINIIIHHFTIITINIIIIIIIIIHHFEDYDVM